MGKPITGPLLAGRPYSGPGDDTLPANVKALPDHAKAIWVAAFNGGWSGWDASTTDLKQEGYAMATAWAAVNKQYKKDADGNWSKRSIVEGADGYFTKVWRSADGRGHWRALISDDGVDQYATRMTIDFLTDMSTRAMAPGGMPWLGISHYDTFSAIGAPDRVYRDGRQLKAEGVFLTDSQDEFQRELSRAAFETARAEATLLPSQRTIRTSIAFVPEAFVIEDCGVMAYTRGSLRHIALTTRPANSRADFTAEEDTMSRSKTLRDLRREDAERIVGEDLAARLAEQEGPDGEARSGDEEGLVYRDDVDLSWREATEGDPADLRHRALELYRLESLGDEAPKGALLAATAALKADIASGAVPKPTLDEARAMFEGAHDVGIALAQAMAPEAPDFYMALRWLVSDPAAVDEFDDRITKEGAGEAVFGRAGRRIKGEVLAELQGAIDSLGNMSGAVKSLKGILEWARENLPEDASTRPTRAGLAPDVPLLEGMALRGIDPLPDASLIATMHIEEVKEVAWHAIWTLQEIIEANLEADAAEVNLDQRLANVQAALNEFGQILNQAIAASMQRSADGDGVKPDGEDGGTVNPPPGEPDAAALAVDETLDAIRALVRDEAPTAADAQVLLDALGERLTPIVTRPTAPAAGGTEALLAAVLERMEGWERRMEELVANQAGEGPPDPASLAPRRSAAVLPPPRRAVRPLGVLPQQPQRRPDEPMQPRDWARGAHLRTGFNPYE